MLGDAIKYVKELKERLAVLEKESKKTKAESMVVLNKPELHGAGDCFSCNDSIDVIVKAGDSESILQVEAKVSGQEVLLRIHCKKQNGLLVKILAEIERHHLFVLNSSVLRFGDSAFDITIIAQVKENLHINPEKFFHQFFSFSLLSLKLFFISFSLLSSFYS